MIHLMHEPYFFLDRSYQAGRGEDLQSLPKSHQFALKFEIGNYLDAEMYTGRRLLDDLLGVMNGFGPDVRSVIVIGPEYDFYRRLADVAGDAYDGMKMHMGIEVLLSAVSFFGE